MNKIIKISLVASALFFFGCSGENPNVPDSRLDKAENIVDNNGVYVDEASSDAGSSDANGAAEMSALEASVKQCMETVASRSACTLQCTVQGGSESECDKLVEKYRED